MIWNVLQIQFRRLMHNRIELALMFVVPIAFFSVFALIFGSGIGSGATPKIKVALIDELDSPQSQSLVESIQKSESLRQMRSEPPASLTRQQATDWVRGGSVTMGIVVAENGNGIGVDLLSDASDQVAAQVVTAVVSKSLATAMPNAAMPVGHAQSHDQVMDLAKGPLVEGSLARSTTVDSNAEINRGTMGESSVRLASDSAPTVSAAFPMADPTSLVNVVDVIGQGKSNPVVSMYAAGIAVMFLLFGATGAGGTLLEERENQTLDRLLSTQMTMDQLLLGKWFYITAVGILQVTVMFVFGQLVFGIDLLGHLDGFLMMTMVTSAAAAAFGLFLATLCKSRGQLNGLSVILVLTMSALGGSMVPRYIMSESLRDAGLWTFNAWALDGYDKIFWRDLPIETLAPQLSVLMISGIGFLFAARILAIRWESQ